MSEFDLILLVVIVLAVVMYGNHLSALEKRVEKIEKRISLKKE